MHCHGGAFTVEAELQDGRVRIVSQGGALALTVPMQELSLSADASSSLEAIDRMSGRLGEANSTLLATLGSAQPQGGSSASLALAATQRQRGELAALRAHRVAQQRSRFLAASLLVCATAFFVQRSLAGPGVAGEEAFDSDHSMDLFGPVHEPATILSDEAGGVDTWSPTAVTDRRAPAAAPAQRGPWSLSRVPVPRACLRKGPEAKIDRPPGSPQAQAAGERGGGAARG